MMRSVAAGCKEGVEWVTVATVSETNTGQDVGGTVAWAWAVLLKS